MSRKTEFIKKWLSATYFETSDTNIEEVGATLIHNYAIEETAESTICSENESFASCHDTMYSWSPQDEKSLFYLKYPWVSNKDTTPPAKPTRRLVGGGDGDKLDKPVSTEQLKLKYKGRINQLPSIDSILDNADDAEPKNTQE